jgi:hypothetical protein
MHVWEQKWLEKAINKGELRNLPRLSDSLLIPRRKMRRWVVNVPYFGEIRGVYPVAARKLNGKDGFRDQSQMDG